ncbi:predicted protein [Lichtheimia corymbifera JMRC:FSU:9682]|uniref:Protein Lines N-terminal domain-containing protein n=1 Tax=Lichtheimia corymbifera JMRC:FSU:9682 TaxID=1263082 RepID=A0A068RN73_9FUNG|nr:predicted protein [Lichtheimia corymbifera JMRC:FSU:9682]
MSLLADQSDNSKLLQCWPWHVIDQEQDPFMLYKWRQRLEHALIGTSDNTTEELEKAKTSWVETAVDKVVDNKMSCTLFYLEIFHAILKQYRKLDLPEAHVGYTLYSTWIGHPQASIWLRTFTSAHDKLEITAYLVYLNDVSKTYDIAFEQGAMVHETVSARKLLISHLQHFCTLWSYPYIAVVRRSFELISRLLRSPIDKTEIAGVLERLLAWADRLNTHFTIDMFWECFETDRTEFYHQPIIQHDDITMDRECMKLAMQVFVASLCSLANYNQVDPSILVALRRILERIHGWREYMSDEQLLEAVLELHGGNDEDAVNLQLDVLTIDNKLRRADQASSFKQCFQELIQVVSPNRLFLWFCERTGMDYSLLVDLLLSNETEFLRFLVEYLKHIEMDPDGFIFTCKEFVEGSVEKVMDMLSRLVLVLEAGGFPYNPRHLINRLNYILALIQARI